MLRLVVDEPPLFFEEREIVCLSLRQERVCSHIVEVEYEPFAVIFEVHDDLRWPSGFGPAEGMDAEGDSLFMVHVKEADASVCIRVSLFFSGEDVGYAGVDLRNRPPGDDLPIGVVCRFIVHGTVVIVSLAFGMKGF